MAAVCEHCFIKHYFGTRCVNCGARLLIITGKVNVNQDKKVLIQQFVGEDAQKIIENRPYDNFEQLNVSEELRSVFYF